MTHRISGDPFESEAWWVVLDNADLLNFDSEWRCVNDILPEITSPTNPSLDNRLAVQRVWDGEYLDCLCSRFKPQLAEVIVNKES